MATPKLQKAAKDYPAQGIKKGDMYYYVRIKTGPRSSREIRSINPIPRSQLTTSDFLSQFYDFQDVALPGLSDPADFESLAEEVRALGEEQQEKYDNMPEGLQQGDTGQLLEERANAMEEWATSIEDAGTSLQEKLDEIEEARKPWTEYHEKLEALPEGEDPDFDEPDGDEPDDNAEEQALEEAIGEIEEPQI